MSARGVLRELRGLGSRRAGVASLYAGAWHPSMCAAPQPIVHLKCPAPQLMNTSYRLEVDCDLPAAAGIGATTLASAVIGAVYLSSFYFFSNRLSNARRWASCPNCHHLCKLDVI